MRYLAFVFLLAACAPPDPQPPRQVWDDPPHIYESCEQGYKMISYVRGKTTVILHSSRPCAVG